MEQKNYYAVKAICGHVGRNKYIKIVFPICCKTKKEAAYIARYMPRVKHDRKDAILSAEAISYDEYISLLENNGHDEYLKCKSKQEQKIYCVDLENRILCHESEDNDYYEKRQERKKYLFKKRESEKKYTNAILKEIRQNINGGCYELYC